MDELSFDVGETIQVIEYDDPEDQVKWKIGPLAIEKKSVKRGK